MSQQTTVRLVIFSQTLSAEEIGRMVGTQCDDSWKIGDTRGNTIIKEKDHGWAIESGLSKQADLEDHLEALFKKIDPFVDAIFKLSEQCDVCISCGIIAEYNPPLFFEKNIIHKLSKIGACIDLDIYVLGENEIRDQHPSQEKS